MWKYVKLNKLLEFSSFVKIRILNYFYIGFLLNQSNALGSNLYFPLRKNLALHNLISYSEFYGYKSRKIEKMNNFNCLFFFKLVKIYSNWLKLGKNNTKGWDKKFQQISGF